VIAAGSLVGFALAFVILSWFLSVTAGAVVGWGRRRLAAAGPAAERTAAAVGVVAPPVLAAVAIVGVAATQLDGADHCEAHGHHLHLCLAHGGEWATRVAPVALVAALMTALAIQLGAALAGILRSQRVVAALRRAGTVHEHDGLEVVVAPSPHRLSLTAGIVRPRVYLSTAVWTALDDEERAAVLAHEAAHARAHDVLWRLCLGAMASLAAPSVGTRLLRLWIDATERLRDHDAATATGDAAVVGSALLTVARVPAAPRLAASAGLSADADLAGRVEALLADAPAGRLASRRIAGLSALGGVLLLAVALIAAEPLHHALETLLAAL
jgi:Zn-dependent protease with chaperone function